MTGPANYYYGVQTFMSQEHHLEMREELVNADMPFLPNEIEGSPMNGVIIPYDLYVSSYMSFSSRQNDDFEWLEKNLLYDPKSNENRAKLIIMIGNNLKNTDEDDKSEALDAAKKIREKAGSAPICIVDQPDNQNPYIDAIGMVKVLMFYGPDVKASTFLVEKNDTSDILKTKFEDWKKELLFLNSHQVIAFHFTVVNSTEPEDSEEIFSNTFPDIPLSTLRLLDESSLTGVDYQIETKSDFYIGPVYAIVGFRKFVEENPVTEDLSEEND
ncbi:hypothetical protein LOAG_18555 [Loa loa]|uniref:Uncharacterized protein n=1 Tax=Loa loa TaxID=7209 RepID=A0A1S0UES0_LOALO|nr:hypothetical protein LOAG_18555 [Loa loa]EJD74075.1 hypothetical protein LOAG_18555 [Loa loa]